MSAKFLIGRKVGMTQYILDDGAVVPVTVVQAGPCTVIERKEGHGSDEQNVVLLGYEQKPEAKCNKPELGFFRKAGQFPHKVLKEFSLTGESELKAGDVLNADVFSQDDLVSVRGRTKGRGFSGTIKRWNFRRGPMSHGSKSHRITGSIGGGTTPGRVIKGKKMAGRYGNDTRTARNLRVVSVDSDLGLLYLKGAVPGVRNGLLEIRLSQ